MTDGLPRRLWVIHSGPFWCLVLGYWVQSMSFLSRVFLPAAALLAAPSLQAEPAKSMTYPETRRGDVVDVQFGEKIADPYRWLENDVRSDAQVADWVVRQNTATQAHLATLPARDWFAKRIKELVNYERFGVPKKAGHRYFYLRNSGLLNQPQLFVRDGLNGAPQLLIDPNGWAKDGATALDSALWEPSRDGKFLAYGVQDGGSDWRILRVMDVASGRVLDDELRWVNDSRIAWVGSKGFLYSRLPQPAEGQEFQAAMYNKVIAYHRIGTPQSADELVYATPDYPDRSHKARVTSDGRYAIITSEIGTDARYEVRVIDLAKRGAGRGAGWKARALVTGFDHDWRLVDALGSQLWFV
ncbi:MAG: hypothetical protein RLY97_2267, partial [Pseudomonadota bacterium]